MRVDFSLLKKLIQRLAAWYMGKIRSLDLSSVARLFEPATMKEWLYGLKELNHFRLILLLNAVGFLLLASWYWTAFEGFWFELDRTVFYFFNRLIGTGGFFCYFVAVTNLRPFDLVSFAAMLTIFYSHYRNTNVEGKRWLAAIGVAMLLSAFILKRVDDLVSWSRISASLYFDDLNGDVNFVSGLTGLPAKDISFTSFPGDHAMMLLIFCAYMRRYLGTGPFWQGVAVFTVFSLPRIMSGAHWLSDVAVGSLSFALIVLSWLVLTPLADIVISWLERKLPLSWFIR